MAALDFVPDARDGLTRAERSVLLAAPPAGGTNVKSAEVVQRAAAETGISPAELYETLVRLTQPWRMRHPLIEGLGNFGSIDDDPRADAVYTEVQRSVVGEALVDRPRAEPDASSPLTGAFPALLANGSWEGLAQIPPHNLAELAAAISLRLDRPGATLDELLAVLPGPDFPTGGQLLDDRDALRALYASGRGELRVRASTTIEPSDPRVRARLQRLASGGATQPGAAWDGGTVITVTELPWGVMKGGDDAVIRRVVEGIAERRIQGVRDVMDESDRSGMWLRFELAPGAAAADVLAALHAEALEATIPALLVALVDGQPRQCSLVELIDQYLDHQRAVRGGGAEVDATIAAELGALASAFGTARRTRLA